MQTKGEHRGFNCPLTEEPCTEGDCLKGQRCCEADRQALAKAREVADKQGRQYHAWAMEIIKRFLPRK
jgi:hypothetical protein